jgi:hypothetical protein
MNGGRDLLLKSHWEMAVVECPVASVEKCCELTWWAGEGLPKFHRSMRSLKDRIVNSSEGGFDRGLRCVGHVIDSNELARR